MCQMCNQDSLIKNKYEIVVEKDHDMVFIFGPNRDKIIKTITANKEFLPLQTEISFGDGHLSSYAILNSMGSK